jgi:hypothetical protein
VLFHISIVTFNAVHDIYVYLHALVFLFRWGGTATLSVPVAARSTAYRSTAARLLRSWVRIQRLRWSRGLYAGLWYPRSRVRSRPKLSDFSCWKNPQHVLRHDTNDTNDNWKSNTRTMRHKIRQKKIPPGAWMFVCFLCCLLSGRGLCDELITRPEESYRLWRDVVCDHEISWYEETMDHAGLQSQRNKQTYCLIPMHHPPIGLLHVYPIK